jgi:hypothetical protein
MELGKQVILSDKKARNESGL